MEPIANSPGGPSKDKWLPSAPRTIGSEHPGVSNPPPDPVSCWPLMLQSLQPHNHTCLIYETPEEWKAAVVPFLVSGLKRGEKCLYVVDVSTADQIRGYLAEQDIDVTSLEQSGELSILHQGETYTRGGTFDPDRMIALLVEETQQAIAEGYPGLRITAEMTWLLHRLPGTERLLEYEAKLNRDFFPHYPCLSMCQYDRWKLDPEVIRDVIRTHPFLINGTHTYRNFYYIPSREYLNASFAAREAQHWLDNLDREQHQQQALRDSEEKYRGVFEYSREATALVTPEGRFLEVNRAFLDLYGYTRDELQQVNAADLYANPADRDDLLSRLAESGFVSDEVRYRRKDGTIIECQRSVVGRRNEQGDLALVQSLVLDVTEQRRSEESLRRSEENYRTLFQQSLDAIWSLNPDGTGHEVNQAWLDMFGYTREDLATLNAADLYANPADREDFLRRIEATGQVRDEVRFKRKDGRIITCQRAVVARKDTFDRIISLQGVASDITDRIRAEEELRKSEEKYRSLFEQSRDPIAIVEGDGTLLEANSMHRKTFGHDESYIGRFNVRDHYVDPAQRDDFLRHLERDGEVVNHEAKLMTRDGTVLDCIRNAVAHKDEAGRITRIQTVCRDITDRKKAEHALRESEKKFRSLFEQSRDAIALVAPDGTNLEANQAWLDLFGYTRDELPHVTAYHVYADPAEREDFLRRITKSGFVTDEVKLKRKDGSVFDCERTVVARRDDRAEIIAYQNILRDITDRKKAERALRESEQKYRSLFEQSMDAISLVSPEGIILDANQAWLDLFGYTLEELPHVTAYHVYADPTEREDFLRRITKSGFVTDEVTFKRKDGSVFDCERAAVAVRDQSGSVIAFQSIHRDISDRIRAQQQLEASHARLEQALDGTLDVIQQISEARDPYTSGHQKRVAELAEAIARQMGLEESRASVIRTASLIHDIGKITVPAEILSKPGNLSNAEFDLIREHPRTGYDILRHTSLPEAVAATVLQHHERLDGSGYPQGLRGDSIVLEAKILAVADVVEAMSSHRPYRPARDIDTALHEITLHSGCRYSPDVVTACTRVFREKGFTFLSSLENSGQPTIEQAGN